MVNWEGALIVIQLAPAGDHTPIWQRQIWWLLWYHCKWSISRKYDLLWW